MRFKNPMISWGKGGVMQIQPLFDRVLLEPITEHTTTGGLVVTTPNSARSPRMKVVAQGAGVTANLKNGEIVFVHRHAGVEVGKHLIVKEIDILAKEVT